ncbi:MAG TPA: hypothetical protein VG122_13010 [Gemmata sp.]|nr:hypothetical protein [Gemmata sp.]
MKVPRLSETQQRNQVLDLSFLRAFIKIIPVVRGCLQYHMTEFVGQNVTCRPIRHEVERLRPPLKKETTQATCAKDPRWRN